MNKQILILTFIAIIGVTFINPISAITLNTFSNGLTSCNVTSNDSTTCAINLTDYTGVLSATILSATMDVTGINDSGYPSSVIISIAGNHIWSYKHITSSVESIFNLAASNYISMTELSDGRLAVAYQDGGNSNYGMLAICNSTGGGCVESVFNSASTTFNSILELSDGRLAVAYTDGGNSSYGTLAICNSSGGSCVENVFNLAGTFHNSIVELSDGRLAVAYSDNGNEYYGTFAICNSSGESCVESVFNSASTTFNSILELSDGRLAVAYQDGGNSNYGMLAICNSTGGGCVESVFNSASTTFNSILELSDGRLAVAYTDGGNSSYGTLAICNSSGGSCVESVFNTALTNEISMTELSDGRLAVAYQDEENSFYGEFAICNSSGGNCVETVFNAATTYYISMTELSDGRLIVAYRDGGNLNKGTFAITNDLYAPSDMLSTETTSDFSSSLTAGVINYLNISASVWGKLSLDALLLSLNIAPTITANATYPATAYTTDVLQFNLTCTDIDEGNTITSYCQIYNSTTAYGSIQSMTILNGTNTNVCNVSDSITKKGDSWKAELYCGDGTAYSSYLNTSAITISNSNPTISVITFSNTYLGQTASASWTFTDSDSDNDTSYYRWYVDGVLNSSGQYNGTSLTFANFDNYGENITFSILGNDGTANSTAWVNSSFLVQDVNVTTEVDSLAYFNYTLQLENYTTFTLSLQQDQNTTLEYNITDNHNASFISAVSYSNTTLSLINTTEASITVTLNSSNVAGSQTFNITLTRIIDGQTFNLPVTIRVSSSSAVLTISPTTIWLLNTYNSETNTRVITISNTVYNASECNFVASDGLDSYLSYTEFSIEEGTSVDVTLSIVNPAIGLYDGSIRLVCDNGTNDGYPAYSNSFDYTVISSAPPTDSSGGGGGGSGDYDLDEEELNDTITKIITQQNSMSVYIQFYYPGHERLISYLPTDDFYKEVVIKAIGGDIKEATLFFSDNLKPYFSGAICELRTGDCHTKIDFKEGEEKYIFAMGNLSDDIFLNEFYDTGKIDGFVQVYSNNVAVSQPYNITIRKAKLFDFTSDLVDRIDNDTFTQKSIFYLTVLSLITGLGMAGFWILSIFRIV